MIMGKVNENEEFMQREREILLFNVELKQHWKSCYISMHICMHMLTSTQVQKVEDRESVGFF